MLFLSWNYMAVRMKPCNCSLIHGHEETRGRRHQKWKTNPKQAVFYQKSDSKFLKLLKGVNCQESCCWWRPGRWRDAAASLQRVFQRKTSPCLLLCWASLDLQPRFLDLSVLLSTSPNAETFPLPGELRRAPKEWKRKLGPSMVVKGCKDLSVWLNRGLSYLFDQLAQRTQLNWFDF